MALALRTWLSAAGLRRRLSRRAGGISEARRELVRRIAPGRSFVDLGGMWDLDGGVAFMAEEAGAERVVLCDGMDPSERFQAEHARRGSDVRFVQGDLHDPVLVDELGTFDVVWCSGVIYHSPNPYLQLEHLRRMTGERLMLGSHVIPELPGLEAACIFYPGLSARGRKAFAKAHGERAERLIGVAAPFDRTPGLGYANFWWGLTPSALRAMLDTAAFEVEQESRHGPFLVDVVARPVDRESTIPPPEFARERGAARRAAFSPEKRPSWA